MAAAAVKLEFPEEYTLEKSNQQISKKMNFLKQKGLEKITDFEGYTFTEAMFYLYLLKKYKSPCFLTETSGQFWEILGLNLNIREIYPAEESAQINSYLQRLAKKLVNCINNDVNIIIIPLSQVLYYPNGIIGGHSNVLIYRKKFNHIEHFEPYGKMTELISYKKLNNSIELLLNLFVEYVNVELFNHTTEKDLKPIELIDANRVCPYFKGFQMLEEESNIFKNLEVEPRGYCSAWSMFFTELCLKNPEMTSSQIITSVFATSLDKLTTRDYFRHIIKGYATFINEKMATYFTFLLDTKIDMAKIKKMSVQEKAELKDKMKIIINIEMSLTLNPNAIDERIKFLKFVQQHLRKQINVNFNEYIRNQSEILVLEKYKNHMSDFNSPIDTPPTQPTPPSLSLVKTQKTPIICPPGKVINLKTNRCVKVKSDKTIRQSIKERKEVLEQELRNKTKECPPGKVLNPDTGRCNKVKTVKTITKNETNEPLNKTKECPPDKMLNPKTGRCVKVKVLTRKNKNNNKNNNS